MATTTLTLVPSGTYTVSQTFPAQQIPAGYALATVTVYVTALSSSAVLDLDGQVSIDGVNWLSRFRFGGEGHAKTLGTSDNGPAGVAAIDNPKPVLVQVVMTLTGKNPSATVSVTLDMS